MKKLKGSVTIEAAVVVPTILFVFVILLYTLFYYHDKNVLMSVAHETVSVGSGRENVTRADLEQYFERRTNGKMLLFPYIKKEITIKDDVVLIDCEASKDFMKLRFTYQMNRTNPEQYIRNIRKLEKIKEEVGEEM